jgi:uncharacterized protein YgbK (DUF1537 family)
MLTVIADDITGAAEIAGIGQRFGMRTALIFEAMDNLPTVDLLVCATDTRSLSEAEAIDETRSIIRRLRAAGCGTFFKKTDSALRGHVVAELETILAETELERVIFVPENPSKGRVIRQGVYYIDEVPLDQTVFSQDPEFPALTADIRSRFPRISGVVSPGEPVGDRGVFVGNAASQADVAAYAALVDERTLAAGAADFFVAYLHHSGWKEDTEIAEFKGLGNKNAIVVCGSTVHHDLTDRPWFRRKNVAMMTMPLPVFELKNYPDGWFLSLSEVYDNQRSIAISVGHPVPKNVRANMAHRLRNIMALATLSLITRRLPDELIIEGGATAFAVLRALGWSRFRVTEEIAPGVVRMSLNMSKIRSKKEIHVTLKPGSYEWGERIFL